METVEFIKPISVVQHSNNVNGLECLFSNNFLNNRICPDYYCEVKGKGYIVLDFGAEFFGGIRISFGNNNYVEDRPFLRIRFGESLMEANSELGFKGSCNDHSTRDMTVYMSSHSDMTWGSTGFRFVRIDFLEDADFQIENIFLAFRHEEKPQLYFKSSNEKLNLIIDAALRTLWLNKQNGVFFEGAKRDQHVWAGDLYPELLAAIYSFTSLDNVKNSISFVIENYPTPTWYNGIPSYNAWFVLTILRYFELTGDINNDYLKCISDNLLIFEDLIDNNFDIDDSELWGLTFFDWSTWEKDSRFLGIKYVFIYALQQLIECKYINNNDKDLAKTLLNKIDKTSFTVTDSKPVNSLALLSKQLDKTNLINQMKENGSSGFSSFLSYFILKSLADNGELEFAYDSLFSYFGGMVDIGGTTLFEEFNISWLDNSCKLNEIPYDGQNDFHGDFGAYCFEGYRKSLCHGWSCGVIPFVIENIVGLHIEDGYKVSFKPNLLDLDYVECCIPTAKGNIYININKDNKEIKLPEGMILGGQNDEK